MTVHKRLVAYHIARLRDRSADARLKAIAELKSLCDPDALDPLQAVFRSDPDPDVRRAAQDAGRAIYLCQQKG